MKKLIYYIAMSILCILPYSCSLDEEARSEMEKKNYMTNAKEAQDVLLGVYRTTVEDAAYGYHLSFLFNMGTDISQGEGSDITNYRIIVNNAFPTTQVEIQQTWHCSCILKRSQRQFRKHRFCCIITLEELVIP